MKSLLKILTLVFVFSLLSPSLFSLFEKIDKLEINDVKIEKETYNKDLKVEFNIVEKYFFCIYNCNTYKNNITSFINLKFKTLSSKVFIPPPEIA